MSIRLLGTQTCEPSLTGLAIWWLLGLLGVGIGLIFTLVFGALISPTDPIAALAILGKVGLPPRLEAIVNGESLFNDGVGVVIFTMCLAVALGAQQPTAMDAVIMFLREVLNAMLFVVIGLHIAIVPQDSNLLSTAAIAVIVCLAARWISVYLPLSGLAAVGGLKADRLGLTNLLTWGGLRGGLAVAMAMSLPDGPEKAVILHMTYGVVAFFIIVQGLTISRFFKVDQLKRLLD